ITVAPASPSAAAMPRPAPRVAPATTATRPRSASRFGDQPMGRVCQRDAQTTKCARLVVARIEEIAQPVAREIERQGEREDREPRPPGHPRRSLEELLGGVE